MFLFFYVVIIRKSYSLIKICTHVDEVDEPPLALVLTPLFAISPIVAGMSMEYVDALRR